MKKIVSILFVVALFGTAFVYFGSGRHADVPAQANEGPATESKVERGRIVAVASDCIGCHTRPGGADFAGGLHFPTPFGDIYSTNITQDADYGIGDYTRDDFFRAVKFGYSRQTGNLYPAMPYTSYCKLRDEDVDALWAYFQTIQPVATPNIKNDVIFPANIRFGLGGWNQLFFDDSDFKPDANRSEVWNRGKYLVEAPGHCGECHTPRNLGFAMKTNEALQGEVIEGWDAEDITANQLEKQGWTQQELKRFFREGQSSLGITYGGMYTVFEHSLSKMEDADLMAVSAFLMGEDELATSPLQLDADGVSYLTADQKAHRGFQEYADYCSGCHGFDGLGQPDTVVALKNNSEYSSASAYNAIAVVLRGLPAKRPSLTQGSVAMPGFASELSDDEIATLVNFARFAWHRTHESEVNADMVKKIRLQLDDDGYLSQESAGAGHH